MGKFLASIEAEDCVCVSNVDDHEHGNPPMNLSRSSPSIPQRERLQRLSHMSPCGGSPTRRDASETRRTASHAGNSKCSIGTPWTEFLAPATAPSLRGGGLLNS